MRIACLFILLLPLSLFGQTVSGVVMDDAHQPVFGASVFWLGTTTGTTTDEAGTFELKQVDNLSRLVVQFVGFRNDTIELKEPGSISVFLQKIGPGEEVLIEEKRKGMVLSHSEHYQTEQLTATELEKGACCDLAGCFNTTASVQPNTTNLVTNSQELRVLGLSGVYNQVLLEGTPFLQGLSYTYGVSTIPGPLIENIFVSKGSNSILQGYESISGQINVILKEPDQAKRLFLNGYTNSFLETEVNGFFTTGKNRWSNMTSFSMAQPGMRFDRDNDGFMDLPLTRRYQVMNKIKFGKKSDYGWSGWMGLRYVHEDRLGGQMEYRRDSDRGGNEVYGQEVEFNQPEMWMQGAYRFNDKMRLHLIASAQYHQRNDWYGSTSYKARQGMVNTSMQFELEYDDEGSNLKTGISYRYLDLIEDIGFTYNPLNLSYGGDYRNQQHVPGVFAENVLNFANSNATWIAGARLDWHDDFGLKFTPRTLIKYNVTEFTTVRASVGYGWRVVNVFPEIPNLLASNRDVIFTEELKPEQAINTGVSLLHSIYTDPVSIKLSADFYHTRFLNQIFPDYDTDSRLAIIENYRGKSVSNSFQADLIMEILGWVEFKTSYNYLDVYRAEAGQKTQLPFNSKHRILSAINISPLDRKWAADLNLHWFSEQRLPNTSMNPPEYQRPDFSEAYATVNAQFSYFFPKFELYLGCENIFDFRQTQPIISWQDPFGPYFDTSSNWGPTRGREFYIGFRFFIDREQG